MLRHRIYSFFLLFSFLLVTIPCSLAAVIGEKAMVVTSDPRATQAALEVLKEGGNAVDAAVAAQWVLNVVQPQASGLGGSGYLLLYDIGVRRILFFDGGVQAPEEAFPDMFFEKNGTLLPYGERSTGGLAVGTPGILRMMEDVQTRYGTKKFSFAKLFEPALKYAEEMTDVSAGLADSLETHRRRLEGFDAGTLVFFENGKPLQKGDRLLQLDLAKTFRLIQKGGADAFYRGVIAKAVIRAVHKNPRRAGLLSYRDLEHYKTAKRDPVHGTYQGYDLFSACPPSTGGVMLLRGLNLLAHFGIPGFGKGAETYHLLTEVQKLAFPAQASVADPDIFNIPVEKLLSQEWSQQRAEKIKFDKILPARSDAAAVFEKEKDPAWSSILVVDSHGSMVALSSTLGDAFGSGMLVPEHGFFLNDQLTDFDTDLTSVKDPASANIPAGGQRPRNTAVPTFLFKEGKPQLVLDAFGVKDPAALLLNFLVQKIDLGGSYQDAMKAPRVLDDAGVLRVEPDLYGDEVARVKLELWGHTLKRNLTIGNVQMICFVDDFGKIVGESDPRGQGSASGL